jgi:hypothetical protein
MAAPAITVPDTATFTLQDVVDSVIPTTSDLVDCFADADAAQFDPTYEGSKNNLYNFRNYGNQTSGGVVKFVTVVDRGRIRGGDLVGMNPAVQRSTTGSGTGFACNVTLMDDGSGVTNEMKNVLSVSGGNGFQVGDDITLDLTSLPDNRELDYIVIKVSVLF